MENEKVCSLSAAATSWVRPFVLVIMNGTRHTHGAVSESWTTMSAVLVSQTHGLSIH